jgi:hypothetical protein
MAELVSIMEDLGADVPEDLVPLLETVGDLCDHEPMQLARKDANGPDY